MDTKQIILIVVCVGLAIFIRYQREKKKKNQTGQGASSPGTTFMSSSKKEDDYEPYSKK